MAEIELSVLTRQCIGRRFDHPEQMAEAISAGNVIATGSMAPQPGDSPLPKPALNQQGLKARSILHNQTGVQSFGLSALVSENIL